MLGLGLSLLGGAVMEDADGARAYFPAAAVRCNNYERGGTVVSLQVFSQMPVTPAEWDIDTMRGAFSCRILRRGTRWAGWAFGCYSSYNDGDNNNANYFFYSGLLLQPGGERNVSTTGNRSVLHYASATRAYSYTGWEQPINSDALGELRFQLNGAALTGTAFGTRVDTTLTPMRVSAEYSRYSNLRLFGAIYLDVEFYGSYWRNGSGAWQCLPMQSAYGSAALFETTTQQLVEHESLSTAA